MVRASARRLQCKIDKSVQAYGKILVKSFHREKLFDRLDDVYARAVYPPETEITEKMIGIDKIAPQLMIAAEKEVSTPLYG